MAHEVGYKRPPKDTQFAAGQSGNPAGRPKGRRNFSALMDEAMEERMTINEGGRRRTVTKGQVIAKQLMNKAASGDLGAMKLAVTLFGRSELPDQRETTPQAEADARTRANVMAKIVAAAQGNGHELI
jgi:hypothetical protein